MTDCATLRNPAYMPTPTANAEEVAATIRAERVERGWTQRQLAEKAGVSLRTITAAEGSEYGINDYTYGRIAKGLGVSLAWLLGRED